jgi:hypothetical protein
MLSWLGAGHPAAAVFAAEAAAALYSRVPLAR